MRLSSEQSSIIVTTIRQKISPVACEIFLYGSRAQDELRGGDIDLLILSTPEGCQALKQKKYEILVDIKKSPLLGERKIDILIATSEEMQTEPFLQTIVTKVLLG